ncbi:SAR2788 family putative toxin [Halalkalibacterium halodurans]|uniref:SAR2788 family putative toxin n=1 Tax=Halalkalibacterium halodurans TaxID=86665 RepID=UPI002E1AAEAA|nr:SAR2788 family putative toxin [Halalkalibacterium halodurans]
MNKIIYKTFISFLVLALILSSVPLNHVQAQLNAEKNSDFEDQWIEEIEEDLEEDLEEELEEENIELLNLEIDYDVLMIETEVEAEDGHFIQAVIEVEPGSDVFKLTVTDIIDGEETFTEYKFEIEELDEEEFVASYKEIETGEVIDYDSSEGTASIAFAIPAGILLSKSALTALYHAGGMIIVGGVAFVAANQLTGSKAKNKKRDKKYNHFQAAIRNGDVYIGRGLSLSGAVKRFKSGRDTWSVSSNQAKQIAQRANPKKSPYKEVDRKDGKPRKGRYWHWHAGNKKPASHAFYGPPVK